jgi:hypothetical protein
MGRRKRGSKDPPESVAWSSYTPYQAKYWLYGGPWVPPEEIPPEKGYRPENIRPHELPATRIKSVTKMLDEARVALEKATGIYTEVHKRGIEALPWDWERERMLKGDYPKGEPNAIHYRLCNAYHDISRCRALVPVYESILDGLDSHSAPLFHWKKG